jgi:peptidoglycan/xylan/chitin deacetylase (PgdA/CDA1 family)
MTTHLKGRLRKTWHVARRRRKANADVPRRLIVTKAKWLGAAASPVVLMIDDLTNAWHNRRADPSWEPGGDWGGGLDDRNGAAAFLEQQLLREFPEARATFFVVAGAISTYTHDRPFRFAAPLDADERSARFFRSLDQDPRFELAYHGYNHGTAGARTEDFLQEWRGFQSSEAAVAQTRKGLEIFLRATGRVPLGGKYGGWEYNKFSEAAINNCGFRWWCRDWMPRDVTGSVADAYYDVQFFGRNFVVALPSTVHGHFWDPKQIDLLLAREQVISIEEHIAPIRPDGLIQTPNIVDDIHELRRLYRYLRGRDVWHANCSAIATYALAREQTLIHDVGSDEFYPGLVERPVLTLRIDSAAICQAAFPRVVVTLPDGSEPAPDAYRFDESGFEHLVTIPVMNGRYTVRPAAR